MRPRIETFSFDIICSLPAGVLKLFGTLGQ